MTNNTSKIIAIDETHSLMRCPHYDECNRAIRWRSDLGAQTRKQDLIAYSWFNRQLRNHTH